MKALEVAMNIGVMMAVSLAIQGITWAVDKLVHRSEELQEKAKEAREQYESTTDELKSQEEALKNVKSQLIALKGIEKPTLADAEQTKELEKQNAELSAQIAYLQAKAEIEKEKAKKASDKVWNGATGNPITNGAYGEQGKKLNFFEKFVTIANGQGVYNLQDSAIFAIKELNELEEARLKILRDSNLEEDKRHTKLELNQKDSDNIKSNLIAIADILKDSDNPEAQALYEKIVYSLSDATQKASMLKSELKGLGVNEDAIDELEKLALSVNTTEGKETFITKLKDLVPDDDDREKILDMAGGIDGVAAALAKVSSNGHASEDVVKGFAQTVDDMFGNSTKITDLFDENGKAISEGMENFFDDNGNVIAENIDAAFEGASEELKSNISTVLQQLQSGAIDVENAKAAFGAAFALESVQAESAEVIKDFEAAFGGAVSGVDGLINSYDELDATLKKISETYNVVNSALEEQNQNGSISIQTALELAKSGANYANCLEVTTNGIRVKENATKEMVEAQINAAKVSLEQAKTEAELKLTFLNLAVGMQPVGESVGKVLIPAFKSASSVTAYFGSLMQSISDGNWKGMFDRASTTADNVKANVQAAGDSIKSSLPQALNAQIKATKNELASIKNMQNMIGNLNYSNFQSKYTGGGSSSKSSGSSSSSSSDDPRLKAWKEMLAVKKHQLEMDQITEEQYYAWLEANYKKQLNNQKKYAEEWRQYEEEIYKWKKQKRLDDWNEAVDLKKHELEMGKIDEGEYYTWLAANYKKYLNDKTKYAEEWRENEEAIHKFEEQQAKDSQDALEDLIDLRVDMLKQEKNNEKDVLKERQDNVKDFYDKQRDLLKEHYDQIDKEEERREKRKKVTDIQAELLELEADDSVEAQKRRLELEESLSDAKKDLNDFERDEELDKAEKMYDDLEEMQTQYYEKQIEAIEDYLDNAYELRQQAIKDLQNGNAQLYQEMIEYNRSYGSTIDADVTAKWEAAYEALNRYNSLLDDNYGMKLDNMTGYNKGKYETAAEREARERATQRTSAKDAAQTIAKNAGKSSGSSNTSRKSGPNRGDKVTIKKSATHFSSQSGNAKMASHVPGGRYTVYQVKGNQVLIGVNGAYTGWVWKSDIQGYATGTPYAKGGIANIDEKGLELILGSPDKGRYKFLNDGDKVFNAKASEFLYKWANQPGEVLSSMIKSLSAASSVSIASPCNITVGDVVINGSADEKTVGELRRAHKQIVTDILNEFKKMKK